MATADVSLKQVQVVDKQGQVRSIILWQCGPDILYADSLDGLMDSTRRKKAPEWLIQQISALPKDRQFHADGTAKTSVVEASPSHVPTDGDAPDFVQG